MCLRIVYFYYSYVNIRLADRRNEDYLKQLATAMDEQITKYYKEEGTKKTTNAIAHMLDTVFQGKLLKTKHNRYEMTKTCIQVEHDLDLSTEETESPSLLERAPTLDSDKVDFSYQTLATHTQNGLSSRPTSKRLLTFKQNRKNICHLHW